MTSQPTRTRAIALSAVVFAWTAACDTPGPTTPSQPPPPPPVTSVPAALTLSGQVYDLTPQGRVPAPAGVGLAINVLSGNCPGIPCSIGITRKNTETGPDGRYSFSDLPKGSAALFAYGTHMLPCGAFTPLAVSGVLDLDVTSRANPQPSPAPAPVQVTGQVYEVTPAGRVGVADAYVYFDWYWESPYFAVRADGNGRYAVCGIPPNWQMGVGAWQDGYWEAYAYRYFQRDTTFDIELKRPE